MNKQLLVVLVLLAVSVAGGGLWLMMGQNDTDENVSPMTSQTDNKSATGSEQATDSTSTTASADPKLITKAELAQHNKKSDCWTIVSGKVYDITSYIPRHPGGDDILLACGADGTSLFTSRETSSGEVVGSGDPHSSSASSQLQRLYIGDLSS